MGMPKTGSTAIQEALAANREKLVSAGVLYPKNPEPFSGQVKHLLYVSLLRRGDPGQWRRFPTAEAKIKKLYGNNFDYYRVWMDDLKKQIVATKPHTLLLSEECFFGAFSKKRSKIHENTRAFISELNVRFEDFELIGYLRSPPDYYLSSCQQKLKSQSSIKEISTANYFSTLKQIRELYLSQHTVFPFDRKIFPQGDVVRHFTKYATGMELESLGAPNETISGPAMCILQEYRQLFFTDSDEKSSPRQVIALVNALRDAGNKIGLSRPVLREDVKNFIWHSLTADLAWLRKEYGFDFDPPRFKIPTESGFSIRDDWAPDKVSNIIDVNDADRNRLMLETIFQLSKKPKKHNDKDSYVG